MKSCNNVIILALTKFLDRKQSDKRCHNDIKQTDKKTRFIFIIIIISIP